MTMTMTMTLDDEINSKYRITGYLIFNYQFSIFNQFFHQKRAPKACSRGASASGGHPPLAEIRLRRTISKRLEFGKFVSIDFVSIDFVSQ